jgi:hypothetical protein
METLSKLFGSEAKVKVMRLFLFNPETVFSAVDISERAKEEISKARREVNLLAKTGLIRQKSAKGRPGYILNSQFGYLVPLQNFLINVEPLKPAEIIRRLGKLGPMKLIITSGVFIQDKESRVDLLVVGDHIKKASLENVIKTLEAEIGKELRYAYFTTEDFKYRLSMFDKLIRDILDYPHRKILNKIGLL